MTCKCADKVDALLAEQGSRLVLTLSTKIMETKEVVVRTERLPNAPRRIQSTALLATFCPFCGKRYEKLKRVKAKRK